MDILNEIINSKEYFNYLRTTRNVPSEIEAIDKIINIFSTIIDENSEKEEYKNIGTKINKFNYEKYINCKSAIDEINDILKDIQDIKIDGAGISLFKGKIDLIHQVEEQIRHKISTYEKGKNA